MTLKGRTGRAAAGMAGFLLLGWGQALWGLHAYRDNLPADLRDVGLSGEMLPLLLVWAPLIALLAWVRWFTPTWRALLSSAAGLVGWFWIDLCLYDSRVASWSTYTLAELAMEVAVVCVWPLSLATLLNLLAWSLPSLRKRHDPNLV
ncbi:hypothetical protein [Pseudomonas multiresinivorans]|uniref:Uncharacterized protein n=2 Tax=Pseudomonas nitroreducens/multiresinivorans group TaxID=627141 RepID=A0A7Z3BR94_9PSED|nr:hypothetical protein [Pseudomonas multiresinivorans]QJP11575.1 hypothetical protein G4G71_28180 [Pseudomonas multiresinivorans]